MIRFAYSGPFTSYFEAECPVCMVDRIQLSYAYYHPDPSCDDAGGAYDPSIVSQRCSCLLGQDWIEDALSEHLGQAAERSRNAVWDDPRL